MADLFSHWCDHCQRTQPHVKFESGKDVAYVCTVCKALSQGKTLADLMAGGRTVETLPKF